MLKIKFRDIESSQKKEARKVAMTVRQTFFFGAHSFLFILMQCSEICSTLVY